MRRAGLPGLLVGTPIDRKGRTERTKREREREKRAKSTRGDDCAHKHTHTHTAVNHRFPLFSLFVVFYLALSLLFSPPPTSIALSYFSVLASHGRRPTRPEPADNNSSSDFQENKTEQHSSLRQRLVTTIKGESPEPNALARPDMFLFENSHSSSNDTKTFLINRSLSLDIYLW